MAELLDTYTVLVHVNAHRWKKKGRINDSWKQDLYQEGYIGLMRAVNTYDENFNTRFTTWAICCIEGAIRNMIGKNRQHENAISLSTLLNESLELEGLFASESTEPDFAESLEGVCTRLDLSNFVSDRELELIRIRYNLEI
jgi:RNA polymerase sigma factor (sigma-70 family)